MKKKHVKKKKARSKIKIKGWAIADRIGIFRVHIRKDFAEDDLDFLSTDLDPLKIKEVWIVPRTK